MHTPQPGLAGLHQPNNDPTNRATQVELGRVVEVHTATDTIDVELLQGGRLINVPILRSSAGRSVGDASLPQITAGNASASPTGQHDTYALIAYLRGNALLPVAIGFLGPKDTALLKRPSGSAIRRGIGGQTEIDYSDGSREIRFSGGSIRIGANGATATLTTIDSKLDPQTGSSTSANIEVKNSAGAIVKLDNAGALRFSGTGFYFNNFVFELLGDVHITPGASGQIGVWGASGAFGGDANLTWDATNKIAKIINPSSAAGQNVALQLLNNLGGTGFSIGLSSSGSTPANTVTISNAHVADIIMRVSGTIGMTLRSTGAFWFGRQTGGLTGAGDVDITGNLRADGTLTAKMPNFKAHKNGGIQNIPNITATKITATTESYDSHGYYDAANSKFTPGVAGLYLFCVSVRYTIAVDHAEFTVMLYKNGAEVARGGVRGSGTGGVMINFSEPERANGTTDFFEIYTYQSGGTGIDLDGTSIYTHWSATWANP